MGAYEREHLTNRELYLESLVHLSCERGASAHFIADLAEIDSRRMYLEAGYPSLYAFCLDQYKLSEDSAWRRIQVARLARRFPAIFDALARGGLHLSGAILLSPHLNDGNAESLLTAAAGKTKSQIEGLIAQRFPRSEMLPMVERLPSAPLNNSPALARVKISATEREGSGTALRDEPEVRGPVGDDSMAIEVAASSSADEASDAHVGHARQFDEAASAWNEAASARNPETPEFRSRVAPIAAERYALHLSIGRGTHEKLVHAQELLSHSVPSGDLAEVLDRALDTLILRLEKQKYAATSNPRPRDSVSASPRIIPAEVRRAVWRRDRGQCTFVAASGRRCDSRRFLEFHHVEPVAHGGPATEENIRLRCRAHNQHEAERLLGDRSAEARRGATENGPSPKPTERSDP